MNDIFIKLNKTLKKRKTVFAFFFLLVFCFVFFDITPAFAQEEPGVMNKITKNIIMLLGWILYFFAFIAIQLTIFFIDTLIKVAQFSDLVHISAVNAGWVIVRDLANMFVILILLIIAFATILGLENYSAKKLLPKLLIMAVLVNFSKLICELAIDFAQVIMLMFVGGMEHMQNRLVDIFNIKDYLAITETEAVEKMNLDAWATGAVIASGTVAAIITLIVVAVLLAVLLFRVILLWIYIILSPLAFILAAFPAGQKYFSAWVGDFTKQVIVGPLLAFFLWLALTTADASGRALLSAGGGTSDAYNDKYNEFCAGAGSIMCTGAFTTYMVTVGLLIGGLLVTQKVGGLAAAAAGKGLSVIRKGQSMAGNYAWRGTKGTLKTAGKGGLALSKAGDAAVFGGAVGRGVHGVKQNIEDRKKHIAAGALGGAVASPLGALAGGVAGYFYGGHANKKAELKKQKLSGAIKKGGKTYKLDKDSNTFKRVNAQGEWLNSKDEVVTDVKNAENSGEKGLGNMSRRFHSSLYAQKRPGEIAEMAAQSDAVQKIVSDYKGMDKDQLLSAHDVESNPKKRMAMAQAAAERGFLDSLKQVGEYKNDFAGNSVLGDKFSETVRNKQAALNYADHKGEFDQSAYSKDLEYNKFGWQDGSQRPDSVHADSLQATATVLPEDKFMEGVNKMTRTTKNKETMEKKLKESIDKHGEETKDGVRRAYAELSGKYHHAYKDFESMKHAISKSSSASSFANLNPEDIRKNENLARALGEGISESTMKKIERSDKVSQDLTQELKRLQKKYKESGNF